MEKQQSLPSVEEEEPLPTIVPTSEQWSAIFNPIVGKCKTTKKEPILETTMKQICEKKKEECWKNIYNLRPLPHRIKK